MSTNNSTWWEKYRETVNAAKYYRQLICLVGNSQDIAQRMIRLEKNKNPGKSESWYLMQLIIKLQRNSLVNSKSQ